MRDRGLLTLAMMMLLPSASLAQEVYGRIWVVEGERAIVAARAAVIVTCGESPPRTVFTGNDGIYRLSGGQLQGQCWFQVSYRERLSERILIRVTGSRTSVNLELRVRNGSWLLRRR